MGAVVSKKRRVPNILIYPPPEDTDTPVKIFTRSVIRAISPNEVALKKQVMRIRSYSVQLPSRSHSTGLPPSSASTGHNTPVSSPVSEIHGNFNEDSRRSSVNSDASDVPEMGVVTGAVVDGEKIDEGVLSRDAASLVKTESQMKRLVFVFR